MKALTVRQPYATRLVTGQKGIENRSQPTRYRGRLLIHAGKQIHDHYRTETFDAREMPRSAVVGSVEVTGCHEASWGCTTDGVDCSALGGFQAEDGARMFHWEVSNPLVWEEPVTGVKGSLGMWEIDL